MFLTVFGVFLVKILGTHGLNISLQFNQNTYLGVKVYPEFSSSPVYAFLGIPYSNPPKRFKFPTVLSDTNQTYYVKDFRPMCPQVHPSNKISGNFQRAMSEECLYLNIWAPEQASEKRETPVLVAIFGEHTHDWSGNKIMGLDLAAQGIIVITIQYRTSLFGWIQTDANDVNQNIGMQDQKLALKWIIDNIGNFGGDNRKITLLGHGAIGTFCVYQHLISYDLKGAIFMSGSMVFPSAIYSEVIQSLRKEFNCKDGSIITCMQKRNVYELVHLYDSIFRNINKNLSLLGYSYNKKYSLEIDELMNENFLAQLKRDNVGIPILIGINSNEAAFDFDTLIVHARQKYDDFNSYIQETLLKYFMKKDNFEHYFANPEVRDAINWNYFAPPSKTTVHLVDYFIKLLSQIDFELPFFKIIESLSTNSVDISTEKYRVNESNSQNKIFAYIFHHSNSIDLKGNINLLEGAAHTADLPFLFGPSLLKQLNRKRLTQTEEKLCKKFHKLFSDFVKTGNPTPERLYDSWKPYSPFSKYIKVIGTKIDELMVTKMKRDSILERNYIQITHSMDQLNENSEVQVKNNVGSIFNPYALSSIPKNTIRLTSGNLLDEEMNTDIYFYFKKIHFFWHEYLYKLYTRKSCLANLEMDYYAYNGLSKYKHAFFSMLLLVCFLLMILALCLYLLKKSIKF